MKKHLSKISFLIIGLSLAATASYLNAWSGPTSQIVNGIPNGNIDAPINLSALFQEKAGGIQANDLSAVTVAAQELCIASTTSATLDCINSWSSAGRGSSVPTGAVMAFNSAACPAGWVLADGNNGTRDLRGSFIRGYGTSTAGTAASGAFGVKQEDDFKSHNHSFSVGGRSWSVGPGGTNMANGYGTYDVIGASIGNTGGTETRPDNVALLFCQKDGTSSGGGSSSSSILASGDSSTNTRYNDYTVNLTTSGILTMSNSYCGNNSGGQITDAKIYVNGELIGYSRVGNACGWYTDCPTMTSTTAQKTLSAGTHTLRSECYVPAGTGIIHKSSYVVVK